jgi:hypothetical protein
MGFFVILCGKLNCLRCKSETDADLDTKLLRSEADNSMKEYRFGDTELIEGLDDFLFCPLYPWNGESPLVVVVGEWGCRKCGLGWQWAKAVFQVDRSNGKLQGTIRELSTFVPSSPQTYDGVHFVENWHAELSNFWKSGKDYNWFEGQKVWMACTVQERCERMVGGFKTWCREIAKIDEPIS